MAKEIKDLMEDRDAAKDFLDKVLTVKVERKRRNLMEMQSKVTDTIRDDVDFVKTNINNFYDKNEDDKEELKQESRRV